MWASHVLNSIPLRLQTKASRDKDVVRNADAIAHNQGNQFQSIHARTQTRLLFTNNTTRRYHLFTTHPQIAVLRTLYWLSNSEHNCNRMPKHRGQRVHSLRQLWGTQITAKHIKEHFFFAENLSCPVISK